ncbi:hypothetical protein HYE82_03955 [Streptomyces sp. BR123]|nr:hypothetical protein [Streptomyces sp. BR123]NXY93576.1 hypothetical protein [Streptomyces sp. BR123]
MLPEAVLGVGSEPDQEAALQHVADPPPSCAQPAVERPESSTPGASG